LGVLVQTVRLGFDFGLVKGCRLLGGGWPHGGLDEVMEDDAVMEIW
jgi:hypothetical protein